MKLENLTDTQVIARIIKHISKAKHDKNFTDIGVNPVRRTFFSRKPGWHVIFLFPEKSSLDNHGVTYELDEDGNVEVFQSL